MFITIYDHTDMEDTPGLVRRAIHGWTGLCLGQGEAACLDSRQAGLAAELRFHWPAFL